jgi:AraC-like DNA-binding protein/mannose-6-phosphate isomerase-like protein (cupin superfamily)
MRCIACRFGGESWHFIGKRLLKMKNVGAMHEKLKYLWRAGGEDDDPRTVQSCLFAMLTPHLHPELPMGIRHEIYEEGPNTGPHRHEDFYALYVVRGGRGIHMINEHPYGIARGDVYLLPPGAIHAYQDYSALTIDAFYFQPRLFNTREFAALRSLAGFWHLLITFEDIAHPLAQDPKSRPEQQLNHRFHLLPEQQQEIEEMIHELRAEYLACQPEATLLAHGLFLRLLVRLARWQGSRTDDRHEQQKNGLVVLVEPPKTHTTHTEGITTALRICEERFHEPLSVPQLAAHLFLSPNRFSELFQREVGMSPATYIRRLRLERAQTLLRTTTLTNTEIAYQVGFRDSSQLSRAFRNVFHLTPTNYRSTFRTSHP